MIAQLLTQVLRPEQHAQLREFTGKSFAVKMENREFTFFYDGEKFIKSNAAPDVTFSGNLQDFAAFMRKEPSKLSINGEIYSARILENAFSDIRPDWQEILIQNFGETVGMGIYSGVQIAHSETGRFLEKIAVSRFEFSEHAEKIQQLQARIQKLENSLESQNGGN